MLLITTCEQSFSQKNTKVFCKASSLRFCGKAKSMTYQYLNRCCLNNVLRSLSLFGEIEKNARITSNHMRRFRFVVSCYGT